ncbi:MAG: 3'(2'),5'-bisphosphate nucleotidase [Sphingobacteriales bacterium 50-39]|nr:3'(2'),5'-bisphosphate nucleotidase CysQ [Sphingobacteriales bacterium]OJW59606.1 MAG: 3'(2'),5'-bisphosphate nucleotidase [Sphingobacteriales bacterium 50-39]
MRNIQGIQIIGIQRSGSNLLRVMLDQSAAIAAPHPPHLISHFMPLMPTYEPMDEAGYKLLIADVVAYVEANPVPWEGVVLDKEALFRQSRHYQLFELVRLVYEQAALAKGARYWCCKSMGNVYFAPEMEAFGIQPKYIFLYRDGRDVAASFKKAIVGEKHIYHLATQWKEDQRRCLALQRDIDPARFFSLSYETLISAPEQTIQALCHYLEIPFMQEMLQFHHSSASHNTAAAGEMWSNLEKPIMSDNTRKFLTSFTGSELVLFELIAGEELQALGYPLYTSREDHHLLSPQAIAEYETINQQLKAAFLSTARPGDLEKRKKQSDILTSIRNRPGRIPPAAPPHASLIDPLIASLIDPLVGIVQAAGSAILSIYNDPAMTSQVTIKKDSTPLTLADRASHEILVKSLQSLTPSIPVVSEEGAAVPYAVRQHWEYFWCIDPLDGTKEFLQRNGEFCINIALIHHRQPVFGMIYIPTSHTVYYGSESTGSWKRTPGQQPVKLRTDHRATDWTAVTSRSHSSDKENEVLEQYPVTKQAAAGSALKFCLIAEGSAHIYYRHGPTMEWDTAAGHAIIQYSGGQFIQPSGEPFLYNKEQLLNGPFLCGTSQIDPLTSITSMQIADTL